MAQEYKLKTWACNSCGYHQDFEPTAENMAIHYPAVAVNTCPACGAALAKETDVAKKVTAKILDDAEIDVLQKTEKDVNGNDVLVDLTTAEKDTLKTQRLADITKMEGLQDI